MNLRFAEEKASSVGEVIMKEKTDSLIDLHLFRSSQPVATWKHNLKVSVILPVYNGQAFLREALESILRQTYRNFEIIAVDDGSTDASSEILQEYRKDISIRAQENSGVCVARNRGVEIASGDLLAFIDQDDIWYENKLEHQLEEFRSSEQVAFSYSDFDLIDSRGRITQKSALTRMKADWMRPFIGGHLHPYPSTVLMRRSVFLHVGGFDSTFKENTHEDVDLWVRLYDTVPFSFIPEALVQYRRDHQHHKRKKRSFDIESENYSHLYEKLKVRFQKDPSKKEGMDRLLSMVLANRGKKLAHERRFTEARSQFREAYRLHPANRRNRFRYLRTFLPSSWRRFVFHK